MIVAMTTQSLALDSFGLKQPEQILEINQRIDDIIVYSSSVTVKEGAGPSAMRLDSDIKALLEKHEKLRQAYAVQPSETVGIIEDLLNYLQQD